MTSLSSIVKCALVGGVSVGKSSLINALVGGAVAPSSRDRQTLTPRTYSLGDGRFANLCSSSKDRNVSGNTIKEIPHLPAYVNMEITDFPGFGDSKDTTDNYFDAVAARIHEFNLVMFVCDATRPFLLADELDYFKRIQNAIKTQLETYQRYIDLIVVFNKTDELDDAEILQMFKNAEKQLSMSRDKLFRASSYLLFMHCAGPYIYIPTDALQEFKHIYRMINGKQKMPDVMLDAAIKTDTFCARPHESGDWDGLLKYLRALPALMPELCAEPYYNSAYALLNELNAPKYDFDAKPSDVKLPLLEKIYPDKSHQEIKTLMSELIGEKLFNVISNTKTDFKWCRSYVVDKSVICGGYYFGESHSSTNNEPFWYCYLKSSGMGEYVLLYGLVNGLVTGDNRETPMNYLNTKCKSSAFAVNHHSLQKEITTLKSHNFIEFERETIYKSYLQMAKALLENSQNTQMAEKYLAYLKQVLSNTTSIWLLTTMTKSLSNLGKLRTTHDIVLNVLNHLTAPNIRKVELLVYLKEASLDRQYEIFCAWVTDKTQEICAFCAKNMHLFAVNGRFGVEVELLTVSIEFLRVLDVSGRLDEYLEPMHSTRARAYVRLLARDYDCKYGTLRYASVIFGKKYYALKDNEIEIIESMNKMRPAKIIYY